MVLRCIPGTPGMTLSASVLVDQHTQHPSTSVFGSNYLQKYVPLLDQFSGRHWEGQRNGG